MQGQPLVWSNNLKKGKMAPAMASGILSITFYYHHFYIISDLLYFSTIIIFILVSTLILWAFSGNLPKEMNSNSSFLNFTIISAASLILTRTYIYTDFKFLWPLSVVLDSACIIYAVASIFLMAKSSRSGELTPHFSQLNIGVALASSSIPDTVGLSLQNHVIVSTIAYVPLTSLFLAIVVYFAIATLIVKRHFDEFRINEIDGTVWIWMGLAALISVACYVITSNLGAEAGSLRPLLGDFRYIFWGISTVLMLPVVFLTVQKIRDIRKMVFSSSLWSVVFPTAVYSYDTYLISRSLNSNPLYEMSLIFDLFSLSLFLIFWVLFFKFFPIGNI